MLWLYIALGVLGGGFLVFLFFVIRRFYFEHLTCGFCGGFSIFSLCWDCKDLLKHNLIYFCDSCGDYFLSEKPCKCKSAEGGYNSRYSKSKNKANLFSRDVITCFICGADSGNKHLCLDCYNKHKGHDVLLKLEAGRKVSVQDKYYEGARILTADGHNVRSDGERAIDNYFFYHNIPHAYEKPLYLDKSRYGVESVTPDFYLPREDTYVEFLGYSGEQYVKENEFKRKIYIDLGVTVIYLYRDDKDVLDAKLDYYLRNIECGKLNYIRLNSYGKMVI